jgi:hypothetical protein
VGHRPAQPRGPRLQRRPGGPGVGLGLRAAGLRRMAGTGKHPWSAWISSARTSRPCPGEPWQEPRSVGMAALKQLSNAGESNVRSISGDRKPPQAQSDHCEGHSEGQNGACGSSLGLVAASVSWCSGWSGHIWPGRGRPEGFMACKRSGVRSLH